MTEDLDKHLAEKRELERKIISETPDKSASTQYKEDYPLTFAKEGMRSNASPNLASSKLRNGQTARPKIHAAVLSAIKSQNMRDASMRIEYLNSSEQSSGKL